MPAIGHEEKVFFGACNKITENVQNVGQERIHMGKCGVKNDQTWQPSRSKWDRKDPNKQHGESMLNLDGLCESQHDLRKIQSNAKRIF